VTRLLLCGSAALALAFPATASATPLVPRDLSSLARYRATLVQLGAGKRLRPAAEATLRAAAGVRLSSRLRLWRVPSRAAQRLVPRLAVTGAVVEVEPDRPRDVLDHGTQGDPLLPLQWWFQRIGADRVEPPGPGRPVTVIDSGLDANHPEFAGRPNTALLNPQSFSGQREFHGTAVASVVAAPANGLGVVGVYPQAVLASWDASPRGQLSSSDVIAGIEASAALGPGVINLSLGGTGRSVFEANAVADAFVRGSIIVAAVGNEREQGSPLSFPANYPHVITVASTDMADRPSTFSSASAAIDIAAPGDDIPAAVPTLFTPTGFAPLSGTSFSAPIVAGAVAWIWTARPELEKTQLIELVRRSARDLGPAGRDPDTGFGLLDLPRALTLPAPAVDPSEPNDDLAQAARTPPITAPGRGRANVSARVDPLDDPRDLYRVFVPAGRRVTVALRSSRSTGLGLGGAPPGGLSARVTGVGRARTLRLTNRGRRGVLAPVSVSLAAGGSIAGATYSLTLTTARAPR
jgi:hypothetical protein